jgi:hypothetical protein
MATYIQGITDYIPQVQPFKPDLNFYATALQTKEAQYKEGYDKISNLYGTLLNSELSRADNTARRDQFFNKLQTDIQKISGLDLSKSENVNAANKIFQPIIDDKYILKDMSFTKAYNNEQWKANYFMNCTDEKKCGGKYWEGGVRALDYQRADFVKAGIEESMGYQNPTYTPYTNVYKKAMEFAKEMGFDTKTISWSPDGRFIMTTKNGPSMVAGLTDSFMSAFASDDTVRGMYKTQAYLDRKDYVQMNAAKFNNDETAAEKEYLVTEAQRINETMRMIAAQAGKDKETLKTIKAAGEESVKKTPINEDLDQAFVDMLNGIDPQEAAVQTVENIANESLDSTNGIDYNKMSLEALRYRIDTAKSNDLFYADMSNAANDYAMNTMEQSIEADPYAKAQFESNLRKSELNYKAQLDAAAKAKEKADEKAEEEALANEFQFDENGIPVEGGKGQVATEIDMQKRVDDSNAEAESKVLNLISQKAIYTAEKLNNIITGSGYTAAEKAAAKNSLQQIFGAGATMDKIRTTYSSTDSNALRTATNGLDAKLNGFSSTGGNGLFRNDSNFTTEMQAMNTQLDMAQQMKNAMTSSYIDNNIAVRNRMIAEGVEDVDLFIDEKGNRKSFEDFSKEWQKRNYIEAKFDDGDDEYQDMLEDFKKYYNSGKVPIKSQYGKLDEEVNANAAQNRVYVMDPSNLKSKVRSNVKDLYQYDIATALRDPAFGNAKFIKGNLNDVTMDDLEDLEEEDAALTKKMLNDIMRTAFTTNWKDAKANRPMMDVTKYGVVAGDPDKVGVTFDISQDYLDQFKGTAKEKGLLASMFGEGGNSQISMVIDRSAVKSNFFKDFDPTPVEYVFNNTGSVAINGFESTAGTAVISKTGSGYYAVNGTIKSFDENTGRLVEQPGGWNAVIPDDGDINHVYATAMEVLKDQAQENISRSRGLIK